MSARSVVGAGLGVGLSLVAVGVVSVWWSPWLFTVGARINGGGEDPPRLRDRGDAVKTLAVAVLVAFAALAAENYILFGWVTAELQKHQP